MQPLARAVAECLQRSVIEQEKRFEVGAGQRIFDAGGALGQAQSFGLIGPRIEQAAEAIAHIRRAADVGFGFGVGAEEGKDAGTGRNFGPGWVCRVELEDVREHAWCQGICDSCQLPVARIRGGSSL